MKLKLNNKGMKKINYRKKIYNYLIRKNLFNWIILYRLKFKIKTMMWMKIFKNK